MWNFIYSLNFKCKNRIFPIWNRIKFYLKNVKFGKGLYVSTSMYLHKSSDASINIGENFTFTSTDCYNPLSRNIKGCIVAYPNSIINIGNNVGMSSPCIWAHSNITIGNYVKIGADCIIMDSDAHSINFYNRRNYNTDKENTISQPIIINDDVLIGARCIILKGVTIGARTVIGAGSVVTHSIPENCIAAGNPCKIIKKHE